MSNFSNKITVTSDKIIENKSYIDISNEFKEGFEKQLLEKLSKRPTFQHKCNNCGGTVQMDIEKHIFRCPYCGSVYAIGTSMINDK